MAGHFTTSITAKKLVLKQFYQRYGRVMNAEPTINMDKNESLSKLLK